MRDFVPAASRRGDFILLAAVGVPAASRRGDFILLAAVGVPAASRRGDIILLAAVGGVLIGLFFSLPLDASVLALGLGLAPKGGFYHHHHHHYS